MVSSMKSLNLNKDEIIEDLLNRSVAEILPSKEKLRELLLSEKKLRIYIGTDPTGRSLHLGHATNYIILEKFRKLGHKVIFLIGDFTARIGDPTDKEAARKQLSRKEVKDNVNTWLKQIAPVIDLKNRKNPVQIVYNHKWLSKLDFEDVIELSSNFTVKQMLERDMFEKRMREEKPIYLHEFFYPLMQGYDSVVLDVDVEMCGNDQKFNALVGRTLLRKLKNKEKFVFITTLLVNPVTKEKMMSKSLGTGVFLDTSADEMYAKVMEQADENIPQLFTDCTYLPLSEIKIIEDELRGGKTNPRDVKMKLAYEIVNIYHGEKTAKKAEEEFRKVYQKEELPSNIEIIKLGLDTVSLRQLVVSVGFVPSKSEAQRLIEQGGIKVDGVKITDPHQIINLSDNGIILQSGKAKFIKAVK